MHRKHNKNEIIIKIDGKKERKHRTNQLKWQTCIQNVIHVFLKLNNILKTIFNYFGTRAREKNGFHFQLNLFFRWGLKYIEIKINIIVLLKINHMENWLFEICFFVWITRFGNSICCNEQLINKLTDKLCNVRIKWINMGFWSRFVETLGWMRGGFCEIFSQV